MAKKLTDVILKSLRPEKQRYEVWDSTQKGFGVRVGPSGSKTFVWVYHFEKKPRRMTFGAYPQMSLVTAHTKLAQAKEALAQGIDPGARAVSQRAAERAEIG